MTEDPVARLQADIADLRHEMHVLGLDNERVKGKLDNIERDVSRLVPIDRYLLVEKVVFGVVGLVLVSFMGALIAVVIR